MSILDAVLQTLNSLKFDGSTADAAGQVEPENLEIAVSLRVNKLIVLQEKLRVFCSLPTIAENLGPVDAREKLIPIISDLVTNAINAGDDEVLLVISQKLSGFSDLVGGKEHSACLLPILEKIICGVEEIVVAQAACDALVEIVPKLPGEVVEDKCVGMIRRILEEDLYCASRKVTTRLITISYPMVSAKCQTDLKYSKIMDCVVAKHQLVVHVVVVVGDEFWMEWRNVHSHRSRIFHLADSDDEVPLVRAAAVQQLVELAKLIGPELKAELCLLLTSLVSDNQRVVRAACIAPLAELGKMMTDPNEFDTHVRPCIEKLSGDATRDTRRSMAASITELQRVSCSYGGSTRSLHQIMLSMLEDNEVETRRIATAQLKGFCLASPKEILSNVLLPQLREHLYIEREESVRAELVRCCVSLLPSIGREDALPLVQHILAFLNDTSSQSKQYVFEHFSDLVTLIPATDIQLTLLPSLLRLWQDRNWRVRLGVVQSVPWLYTHLPESCARDTVLPANFAWLRDTSWYVRECACRSLARLLRAFPGLCKDVLNGLSQKAAVAAAAAAAAAAVAPSPAAGAGASPTSTAGTNSTPSTTTNSITTAAAASPTATTATTTTTVTTNVINNNATSTTTNAGGGQGDASVSATGAPLTPGSTTGSLNTITVQAAAGGLKALATDTNYHLRQIYVSAVQTIWGPGIPDESPYSATGDSPSMGICLPGLQNAYVAVSNTGSGTGTAAAAAANKSGTPSTVGVPAMCQPPPQLPVTFLGNCASQVLRLAAEDSVANVRIAAMRSLQLISGSLDKKFVQKEVVPALRKAVEHDTDGDVRYFAQECLTIFAPC